MTFLKKISSVVFAMSDFFYCQCSKFEFLLLWLKNSIYHSIARPTPTVREGAILTASGIMGGIASPLNTA